MAIIDRYLLAMFLNAIFDWVYYYALGTSTWHSKHIGTLWAPPDTPHRVIIRSTVFGIYYVAFACIFTAATAHMEVFFTTIVISVY